MGFRRATRVATEMFHFDAPPPLSLYIHLPWCVRKCPYCDFNSHEARQEIPEQDYVDALLRDLEEELPRAWGRLVRTVFLGGGTPSLFSPAAIERLLAGVRSRVHLVPEAEITLEANPGTVDTERFRGFRAAGVNRLSIGVQSFEPEKLRALGRIHDRDQALRAADAARAAGFDNFNLDLMYGLPNQSIDQALNDIRAAIALGPTHLSAYQLTLEPNTLFHAQPPTLPDDDTTWAMQEQIERELASAGFLQYEVSAYARAGRECRHNLNYWRFGDYLGIGAGAHGKLTDASGISRRWKVKQPAQYLMHAGTPQGVGGDQRVTATDVPFEFMLNTLRLTGGFPTTLFVERTGLPLAVVQATLRTAQTRDLLTWADDWIRPTEHGRRFLNDLQMLFLPQADTRSESGS